MLTENGVIVDVRHTFDTAAGHFKAQQRQTLAISIGTVQM